MLKGIDVRQRIEFSSKEDDGDPKTVFVLKPLSGAQMLGLTGEALTLIKMLELGIDEIRDFGIPDLSIEETLNSLPTTVVGELLEEFNKINGLTVDDKKN